MGAMRWSPWASAAAGAKRRYRVTVEVRRIEGFPAAGGAAAVEIRWKGPAIAAGGMTWRRRKQPRGVSRESPVGDGGVADWGSETGDGFSNVCCFCDSGEGLDSDSFKKWEVSFSVLHGLQHERDKNKKLAEIGTTSVNIAKWISSLQIAMQGEEESQFNVQQKQIPVSLLKDRLALLYVDVSFVEVKISDEAKAAASIYHEPMRAKECEPSKWRANDGSCTFDNDILDLDQLLQLADKSNKLVRYRSRSHAFATTSGSSSSGGSSPESQSESVPKPRFLPWRKQRKDANKSNDEKEAKDLDSIGRWEDRELVSRDQQTKLKAQAFFASIDQRDETAGGESACTALVAVIADALYSKGAMMPTRSEFDSLIRDGSSEWRKLCNDPSYIDRFPNKHFDLDTVLEARIRPISVVPEKSFVGFFQPESFESLRGTMSFEDIWDEVSSNEGKDGQQVYIVSWNDHFFLLKAEADAYYVVDTLGERLFEGCSKAYMLRFDESAEMYKVTGEEMGGGGDELVCRGRECCREFVKRFLAAIPLREELEIEEKGGGNMGLHQRLQIELHYTKVSDKVMHSGTDWR